MSQVRSRLLPVAALTLTLLGLAACGAGTGSSAPDAPPRPALEVLSERADLADRPLTEHLRTDDTPVVVAVFATWCRPCRAELALLERLAADEPRVRFVAVNAHETWADRGSETSLRRFAERSLGWVPVVVADAELLASLGAVPRIPAVFVFTGDGEMVRAYRNVERPPPTLDELRADLDLASDLTAAITD